MNYGAHNGSNHSSPTNLTQSQMLLWTGQQLDRNAPLYNMVLAFELNGPIQVSSFKVAFQCLLQQSDAMRTVFLVSNGIPQQKVRPALNYELEILDWSAQAGAQEKYRRWALDRSRQMLNLSERCFDSVLIKLAEEKFVWYFNQHHLITDAWAVAVLYQKMAELYGHALEGTLPEATALPLFQTYIQHEQHGRDDPQMATVRAYWQEKLQASPGHLRFYGRNYTEPTTRSTRVSLNLGLARSNGLRRLAQEKEFRAWTQHLSLFNLLATALFAYLYRVCGQNKLSIGAPAHNRPTPAFKATPGVFIEIFPLLAEVKEEDSFMTLLQRIKTETNGFLRYAQAGANAPELSRSFNVILNYIHASFADFKGLKANSEWIHPGHCDPRHYLRLQVHDFDESGSIQLHFDLNDHIFDPSLQAAVPQHFLRILDAILENPKQPVGQPVLMSEQEYQSKPASSGISSTLPPADQTIIDLFQQQVQEGEHNPALRYRNAEWSYQQLNQKANQLARYLSRQGITSGTRVGIYMTRCPELLTAILAVLKTGASYIPIAADYPAKRIEYMLQDGQVAMLLTRRSFANQLKEVGVPALYLDQEWPQIGQEQDGDLNLPVDPSGPAYIMYTSGSTGQPKGVMISHRALNNYVQWAATQYVTSQSPAMPLFTSIAFDLTVTSLFLPLVAGGTVVIYEESLDSLDLSIMQLIEDNSVDLIKLTPSHLALLKGKDLGSSRIRTWIVGGEDFKVSLADEIDQALQGRATIYNEYGPTEATVGCVVHRFQSKEDIQGSVPIGTPIHGMKTYLLDDYGNPVPAGITGELFLAGAGLAGGYWNRPGLTRENFLPNRFDPGSIMYRTGDLARINEKGQLEYLGRKDQQVKIRGMRIELGEIEAALGSHPDIQNCVVTLNSDYSDPFDQPVDYCIQCGLPSNYPTAEMDENGVCNICRSFEQYQEKARRYFKTMDDLKVLFTEGNRAQGGEYDCLMLLSGGKDSTYALAQLVAMGLNVLSYTLDNGYISDQAKANIRRVVTELGVDHVFGQTPAMNAIFVDSLQRHCNVCNGCFKTLYTLSTALALEKGIPYIVTGLSRGQFFETRLTEELFWDKDVDVAMIDQMILEARKAYHRVDDAVNRLLDVSMFEEDRVFEQVQFIDFYRYCNVSLAEMLAYLDQRLPWIRPTDTGRSTNCLINQVGIYVHKKEKGYNNYAFPYSWDVRIGHKTREAALEEINEEINEAEVRSIINEIGYPEADKVPPGEKQQLTAYYVSGRKCSTAVLKAYLAKSLPEYMIPSHFIRLEALPLTPNGKIDRDALPKASGQRPELETSYQAPVTEIEELLASLWSEILQLNRIGIHDNFIELGGHSLEAIRLIARVNDTFDLHLPLSRVFEFPTIAAMATHIEETIMTLLEQMEDQELEQ